MRILALCHTPRDIVGEGACSTYGLPMTMETLSMTETLDIVGRNKPDHAFDLTKPIPKRLRTNLHGRFDVVTTVCCPYYVFVQPDGMGLVEQAFANVAHMLKPSGFFIFSTAGMGIASLHKHIRVKGVGKNSLTKQAVVVRVMAAFGRHIDGIDGGAFRHVNMKDFKGFYNAFVERHATTFIPWSGDRHSYAHSVEDLQRDGIIVLQKKL